MNDLDNGGPAFPSAWDRTVLGLARVGVEGMSLRDWFAGMAIRTAYQTMVDLNEMVSSLEEKQEGIIDCSWSEIAASAYDAADAMLNERLKGGTKTPPTTGHEKKHNDSS